MLDTTIRWEKWTSSLLMTFWWGRWWDGKFLTHFPIFINFSSGKLGTGVVQVSLKSFAVVICYDNEMTFRSSRIMNPTGKRNLRKTQEIINIIAHEVHSIKITLCGYRKWLSLSISARAHVLRQPSDLQVLGLCVVERGLCQLSRACDCRQGEKTEKFKPQIDCNLI